MVYSESRWRLTAGWRDVLVSRDRLLEQRIEENMDKETRLALLIVLVVIAGWRFARYMRAGLSRSQRTMNLGVAGGVVPQDADRPGSVVTLVSSGTAQSFLYARIVGVLVAVGVWLGINALLWYCVLEVHRLRACRLSL